MKKIISVLMVALMMGALLTGCFNAKPAESNNQPKLLKILGYEHQVNELSQLFEVSHDVTVEIIDLDKMYRDKEREIRENQTEEEKQRNPYPQVDMYELMQEAMTGPNRPDVVYLGQDTLPKLADEGLLLPLETYITKEKYDIEKIAPAVREGITELGNGTLYALAPTYYSSALFYNKDFFTARGVSFPTDGMTWEEIFNLARELKHEENGKKRYGLSFGWGDLSNQISTYAAPLGLTMFDEDFKTFTVDTPEMERIWNTIVDLNNEGIIAPQYMGEDEPTDGKYNPYSYDDFISGRAAMKIGNYSELRNLSEIFAGASYWGPDAIMPEPFEWDVVTLPVHEEAPGVGGYAGMSNLMGINANAENADLAWQYISFINGDRVAKVLARKNWELPSRTDFAQAPNGLNINMNAFTALKPVPYNTDNDIYKKFPYGNAWELYDINYRMLEAVKKGEKTVKEALAEYQAKGQEVLDRLNKQLEDGTFEQPDIGIPRIPGMPDGGGIDIDPIEEDPADGVDEGNSDTDAGAEG